MPPAQKMVGGRSEQAAGVHRWTPGLLADLHHRLPVGQEAEVPGRAEPGDEIHLLGQSGQRIGRCGVRIERSVNRTNHFRLGYHRIWLLILPRFGDPVKRLLEKWRAIDEVCGSSEATHKFKPHSFPVQGELLLKPESSRLHCRVKSNDIVTERE